MKRESVNEVITCLSEERTLFRYFKGQYALMLLSYVTQTFDSVRALKQTPYQRLLNQSEVKPLLAQSGKGGLSPELFNYCWKESSQNFILTLDRWDDDDRWSRQTTRAGSNLVLQLNFSEEHNRLYRKMINPDDDYLFNYYGHPVMEKGERFRDTLAWARLDIDLNSGEVLIEEIQSDWVRRALACATMIKKGQKPWHLHYCNCKPEAFLTYTDKVLKPFISLWSEAMLMAAISFIYIELGIRSIYYHTYEAGAEIKRICGQPPKSLYSDLPRKFCFQTTDEDPLFLQQDRAFRKRRRKLNNISWYKLEL